MCTSCSPLDPNSASASRPVSRNPNSSLTRTSNRGCGRSANARSSFALCFGRTATTASSSSTPAPRQNRNKTNDVIECSTRKSGGSATVESAAAATTVVSPHSATGGDATICYSTTANGQSVPPQHQQTSAQSESSSIQVYDWSKPLQLECRILRTQNEIPIKSTELFSCS